MTITMRSLAAAALLCLGALAGPQAHAQTFVVTSCPSVTAVGGAGQKGLPYAIDTKGNICSSSAGSGGLSVTDQAAWSQGVSAFTPHGGVFNDTATLSSGQQGTQRLTTKRAGIIDVDTTGNALYTAITGPVPAGTNTIGTVGQLPYPVGATPITASATGTTGATTATLAGTSGKTTYICGYSIRANATAAATVTNTITGVITATLSSVMWVAPLASGIGLDEMIFSPCIPASATNTGIAIVSGAPGAGGTVSSKGWGYQL